METYMMSSTATAFSFAPFVGAAVALTQVPAQQNQSMHGSDVFITASTQAFQIGLSWHRSQLNRIAALGDNWDGYGAPAIEPKTTRRMHALLDQLLPSHVRAGNIVPGADGSLQAEWHFVTNSFGFLLGDDGAVSAWIRHRATGAEVEKSGVEAYDLFISALNYLAQDV
jgi:hypothetical protein